MLPHVKEEGELKKRVDLAIHSLKYGLVRAVSIGFHTVAGAVEALKSGGLRFKEWEWVELSLVNIPANREATIETVRSVVRGLAASGTEDRSCDSRSDLRPASRHNLEIFKAGRPSR